MIAYQAYHLRTHTHTLYQGAQFVLASCSLAWGLFGECLKIPTVTSLEKTQHGQLQIVSWLGLGLCVCLPLSVLEFCMSWTCTICVVIVHLPPLSLRVFLPPLSHRSLSPEGRRGNRDLTVRTECSESLTAHVQLWASVNYYRLQEDTFLMRVEWYTGVAISY